MEVKYYPCNTGYCPYGAESTSQCREYCGLGVDENEDNSD